MTQKNSNHQYDYDLLVIGGGPGGYVAAIRAAQLGLRVGCIDRRKTLGGTCLNVGCIPSKALLNASSYFETVSSGVLDKFGIQASSVSFDLKTMMAEKYKTVSELTSGIAFLFKKNKVDFICGQAGFLKPHHIKVGDKTVTSKDIIIATGSSAAKLPGIEINSKTIVDSTGALSFESVPDHLVVIGGGVIGLELGSVWKRLGAKVTVIEYAGSILGEMDADISKEALSLFKKQGLKFDLGCKVTGVTPAGNSHKVNYERLKDGKSGTLEASHVLVAIGRKPHTEGLSLDIAGLKTDAAGYIPVNKHFQTSVPHIRAIGDVTPGIMLAHRAEDEAIAAAEYIAGQTGYVNHDAIPNVVYTKPEIASVGLGEAQAKAKHKVNIGKFLFAGNSRAKSNRDTPGFVKVIADAETDIILGVHIIGPHAGDLIAQAVQAIEFGATSEDIAYTCHAHPTYAEALKEASMSVKGSPIHM